MPELNSAETRNSRHAHSASEVSIMSSQDDVREDPAGRRVLYILGCGIAGAIFANATIFSYFVLFYVSG